MRAARAGVFLTMLCAALIAHGMRVDAASGPQWQTVLAGHTILSLAVDPSDPHTIYAAGPDGLFKSASGRSWQLLSTTPLGSNLVVDPHDPTTLYATTGGPPPGSSFVPIPSDPSIVRSKSGGREWDVVYTSRFGGVEDVIAIPGQADLLLAALTQISSSPLVRTLDGGQTWTSPTDPMLGVGGIGTPSAAGLATLPGAPDVLYVGYSSYHFGCIWKTVDAAALPRPTWTCLPFMPPDPRVPGKLEYAGVTFLGASGTANKHTVYAFWVGATGVGVFNRSDDDGPLQDLTSALPFSDQPGFGTEMTALLVPPTETGRLYTALQGRPIPQFELPIRIAAYGIFTSADGGTTWSELGHITGPVHALALSAGNLYAATDQGVLSYPVASNDIRMPTTGGGGANRNAADIALLVALVPLWLAVALLSRREPERPS